MNDKAEVNPNAMVDPKALTKEQEDVLSNIFGYSDKADINEDDILLAKQMFDTPEKFAFLRKVLQVLTKEELGLTWQSPTARVSLDPADKDQFVFDLAVERKVDETQRQVLLSLYQMVRDGVREDMKEQFEAENQETFEEEKRSEAHQEQVEVANRNVGPNL